MAPKKRLAETLVEEGIITEAQLQSALQRQLIMGGKIGTNLVELRYISEKQLDDVLSEIYRIPYASPDLFPNIPLDVISSIPKEIAKKRAKKPYHSHTKS
ncbi:MAG: GspIIEN domain protein [Deltaproteobacteria bacterium]|nr:GspIIEN domain protein [Deltaproteobacteria bacterium]